MREISAERALDYGGPVDRAFEPFPHSALDASIIHRFEVIRHRFASRVAIDDGEQRLTYTELGELIARIAVATSQAVHAHPGPVGILLPRDVRFPAAMLAVLAAGRGFIPFDANDPTERNRLIALRAGAAAVICAGDLAGQLNGTVGQHIAVVDIDSIGDSPVTLPAETASPDDLACIVYTSGSTGTPKGVQHDHRNILHTIMQRTNAYHLNPEDRVGLLDLPTSIAGLRDIFVALLNGASLHMLSPTKLGTAGLVREIDARGITIFRTVPVLLRQLADALGPDRCFGSVRIVVTGGQQVDWTDFDAFARLASPSAYMHVGSGLTETAGQFSGWFVAPELRNANPAIPIGRIHPDLRVTLVDETGQPVSDGEVGEFVVSGRYITQGYWNDPELTAQVFAADAADPKSRVFSTGDWGRRREDGLIEFIGRKDQQIKLNGRRIEVGEIEVALRACAGVQDAVVVVRKDKDGLPRSLKAYVEPKQETGRLIVRELTASLKARLPTFMVPNSLEVIGELPRLPNLKVDREELRRRDEEELARAQPLSASPTEVRLKTEEMLLDIWRDVLDRQDVGYDDDFFLSGGSSIAAMDLILRVEKHLHYSVPLTLLAEAPTVRRFCERLETNTLGAVDDIIRIHADGSRTPLFAVPGGGGHALGLVPLLRSFGPDQPCYGLQPPGMDWSSIGSTSLEEIASHYLGEIRSIQPNGPYRLLGDSFGGMVVFEIALQLQRLGEPVELLAMLDTYPPTVVLDGKADCPSAGSTMQALSSHLHGVQPETVLAQNDRISRDHARFSRDYVLDRQCDAHFFRGKLTYFLSTGTLVEGRNDRRRLWQHFADQVRLLPVPGLHGTPHREPQFTVLANLLGCCLNNSAVPESDFGSVFDRIYGIDDGVHPSNIVCSTGEIFPVLAKNAQGCVNEVRAESGKIRIAGWALEPSGSESAQTVVVFLNGEFIGYGACGEPRPDIAKYFLDPSKLFSGFDFSFESPAAQSTAKPRLFVLSRGGLAAELTGIDPVTIGSVHDLSQTGKSSIVLSGNWASRESWGVWSDGERATVSFDASEMPDHFMIEIEAKLFPEPKQMKQRVRVSSNGRLLGTITNRRPQGKFVVSLPKSSATAPLTSLDFDIDHPTSPRDMGIDGDSRKLGIGLISLTFKKQSWWRTYL